MPKISIIVPVYNVEEYLSRCIDSILEQTFTDFELILIDDGSTDNSGKICDEYSKKDSKVKVIHKENGGLSSARNFGIDVASGKFLGFVDSDDYIEKDMYELLYEDICKINADIAICGIYDKYENKCHRNKYPMQKCVLGSEQAFKLALEGKTIPVSAVNKLYKREIFKKKRFPVGKNYEDAFLIPELLINSNKVSYNPLPKYYYVHRENSITTNEFKIKDLDIIDAYTKNLVFVKSNYPQFESQALFRYIWSYMFVFDKICMSKEFNGIDIYNNIVNEIKRYIPFVLKNSLFSIKRKISAIILFISPKLYKKMLFKIKNSKF